MPSDDVASSADEDFEMARLDDIAVTPNPRLSNGYHHYPRFDEDEDDDGARALLGAGGRSSRWRQTLFGKKATVRYHIQSIVIETLPTLLFTTTGLMFTGELLATVSHREAMRRINELIMIVPVILNLKGNLEMNLSARLGTAANMGALDTPKSRNAIVFGNLALLQVQAAVVSFVAAIVAFILGLVVPDGIPDEPASAGAGNATTNALAFRVARTALHYARVPRPTPPITRTAQSGFTEFVMVAAASMSAACISALFLGSFMCGLIVLCRKLGRDPDNIAPPIAACLGDLVTLFLLSLISGFLIHFLNTPGPYIVILLVVASAVACGVLTRRNEHVRPLLTQGWAPLFGAMVISSGTGIVLDTFVSRYTNYALLAIAISGLPGNTGAILTSRLSTSLHTAAAGSLSIPMDGPRKPAREEPSPRLVLLTLLAVTLPIAIAYLAILHGLGWLTLPVPFLAFAFLFFCCAVTIALLLAQALTNLLWARGLDPDMYALPIHSASMDLIGQLLLVACFEIVAALGVHVRTNSPAS
ncbi:hypothetical protein DENSPDRAFT_829062 [Dentipellis sp. KUC8613]|nr:hypothetical protein DENSPDRAFT_829062 [Dentipellis sp. KUC8613]